MTALGKADPSSKDHFSGQMRFVTFAYILYSKKPESMITKLRGKVWLLWSKYLYRKANLTSCCLVAKVAASHGVSLDRSLGL
jgi:hypothetical protein